MSFVTDIIKIIEDEGEFTWSTPYGHPDNTFTMNEFLETYLPEEFLIFEQDGSYAEVSRGDGRYYTVHAGGDGSFYNHKVRFEKVI